jgi:hypothetical protein
VPDVGDACSSYIARSAYGSLPVVSATISSPCLCQSSVPRSHIRLCSKARRALGTTRECTRLVHMALHPSWRGSMAPARLSCCICKIGRHGQVLGLQNEAFRWRLRRVSLSAPRRDHCLLRLSYVHQGRPASPTIHGDEHPNVSGNIQSVTECSDSQTWAASFLRPSTGAALRRLRANQFQADSHFACARADLAQSRSASLKI